MRNTKSSFGRIDGEFDHASSNCPDWISALADKLAKSDVATSGIKSEGVSVADSMSSILANAPKTAVEVARERNSNIYERMSNIISGNGRKFSSVDEVVADYRRRTGLEAHMQNSSLKSVAANIVSASEEHEKKV